MEIIKKFIRKVFTIKDVSVSNPCLNCNPCVRLRIMELGMIEGEKIEIVANQTGLWRINILGTNGLIVSRIALRDEEFKRLFIKESECPLLLI